MNDILYFVIALAAITVIVVLLLRMSKGKTEFDERQELIRGRAYKYAFFTVFIGLAVNMIAESVWEGAFTFVGVSACFFLGLTVFAVYCILHDAFFSLNQKPGAYLMITAAVIISSAANVIGRILAGQKIVDMIHSPYCLSFMCMLAFAVIFATIIIKLLRDRRED